MGTAINTTPFPTSGHCGCGEIVFRLNHAPLFTHCCHCTWCQRESGSAFALNAMIESDKVELIKGTPQWMTLPSASGFGQQVAHCGSCKVNLWSHYGGMGPLVSFVRVGTLKNARDISPDIHIFTSTRVAWLNQVSGIPEVEAFYDRQTFWPTASLDRLTPLLPQIKAYRANLKS